MQNQLNYKNNLNAEISNKYHLIASVILGLLSQFCFTQINPTDLQKAKMDYCIFLAMAYCTDDYSILYRNPSGSYTQSLNGKDKEEWKTNFHRAVFSAVLEINKVITRDALNVNGHSEGIEKVQHCFINKNIIIICPVRIRSRDPEKEEVMPDSLHEQISWFKHYIGDTVKYFWYESKIYEILNYFDAYYQGCKADVELRRPRALQTNIYNRVTIENDPKGGKYYHYEGRGTVSGLLDDIIEQKLFISWYLRYARQRNTEFYEVVYNNVNLRIVYTLLDEQLTSLIKTIQEDPLLMRLYRQRRKQFMTKEDIGELEKFRLSGLTRDNYKKYLEK